MYWNSYYPCTYGVDTRETEKSKYITDYLSKNIGKQMEVILNYSGGDTINQDVTYKGKLKEVGVDYFIITTDQEEVALLTVNYARAIFPKE